MHQDLFTFGAICFTLLAYALFRRLYLRYNHPLINIVVLGSGSVIAALLLLDMPYSAYVPAQKIMTFMLGPATVALAVPLYRNRQLLRTNAFAIFASVAAGSAVAMISAGLIAKLAGLPREIVASILPKGVTIPFAVELSHLYGGEPAITIAFVVATGTLGGSAGLTFLTWSRITSSTARGLAMGTVAHGQGTAMSFMEGEEQGAMSGLAMTLAGIMTAAMAPFIAPLLL